MTIESLLINNCRKVTERATDYMERRLTFWGRLRYKLHLLICGPCHLYLDQMDKMVKVMSNFPREAPPAATAQSLLDTFRQAHGEKKPSPHP
jgi:hypothetical protein